MTQASAIQFSVAPLRYLLTRLVTRTGAAGSLSDERAAAKLYANAEAELQLFSDDELADIGLHRSRIAHAVRYGRPSFAADTRSAQALHATPDFE